MSFYKTLPILAIGLAVAGTAAAAKGMENDALTITQAKIPLIQAVTAAEQHAHGKAARAEYEHSKQGGVYDVEVISGIKVFDVKVDANKGTVLSMVEDKADHGGNDKKD